MTGLGDRAVASKAGNPSTRHRRIDIAFNPLEQTGIPIDEQFRNWTELNATPFDKHTVDPYTRTRVILMNGIEVESILFSHQFARHTDNPELKRALAMGRVSKPSSKRPSMASTPATRHPWRPRSATSR
jgi:hypothetical protein